MELSDKSMTIGACILLSFLPVAAWIYFFQRKNPEKLKYILLTFLAGMLSVVPIKLYEKYWDMTVWYFEHINLFEYLSDLVDVPSLSRLLAYITVNALVAMGLFFFTAFLMFLLETFSGDNKVKVFEKKSKRIFESPFFFISVGVLCGIFAYFFSFTFSQKVWFFVVVGMLEEYIKHLVLRFSDEEKIESVDDAISFAIIVALGFSFVENTIYLKNFWESGIASMGQFFLFYILRSSISVIAHICFSAVFGYYYGISKFARKIYQEENKRKQHSILEKLHMILHLKGSTLFHEEKMMEGMLIAMVMHAIFNSLLEFGRIGILMPLLFLSFFIVLNLFHRKKIHFQTGNLSHSLEG